jgi:ribosome-associated protein
MHAELPEPVPIRGEMIRLGQFLKLAGVVDGGGEAKALLAEGEVTVNGEPDPRRGRQLHPGDVVATGEGSWQVAGSAPSP